MDKNIVCVNLRNMEIVDHIREGETKKGSFGSSL